MRRVRLSVAGMMGFVLLLALGFAALRHPTPLVSQVTFTTTLVLLTVAVLGALYDRRPRRAFWGGFAIVGWGYLAMNLGPWFDTHVAQRVFVKKLIEKYYNHLSYEPRVADEEVWAARYGGYERGDFVEKVTRSGHDYYIVNHSVDDSGYLLEFMKKDLRPISPEGYHDLCHSFLGLIAALLGGIIARNFAASGDRPDPSRGPSVPSS
ncbi:MAG TPA: hypothetical protein VG406_23515 [Isosphaeraceae bacterium]|jgi:hypothetical protein|nr:hypothetical protein [Isosphaeraceae bacterium]